MGFIKAFADAVGGAFSDQWKDFLTVPAGASATAGTLPAVAQGTNAGRGANTKGSQNIISNGSKLLVPEGFGLITVVDGRITGFIAEPGGYEYRSDDQNAQSLFAGDGLVSPLIKTSWERFKFGGQPGSQHLAFFVNLKEIPNNRFGTQSEIYWDDSYLRAQVGAVARGSYTLKIIDPILFASSFVPVRFLAADAQAFDFADVDNAASTQLFNEIVASLAPAFSKYVNDEEKNHRISNIQRDSIGLGVALAHAVEESYFWVRDRGLNICRVAIEAIEYDADTRALLSDVKKADALGGDRGNSFMQQAAARGVEAAGEGGGAGLMAFGMGAGAVGLGGLRQEATPPPMAPPAAPPVTTAPVELSPLEKLSQFKAMLDQELITPEEFAAAKAKVLGL